MKVTRVRDAGRKKFDVYIDNEFGFQIYEKELRSNHIEEGGELSRELFDKLTELTFKRAKAKALRLLTSMDRTEAQLKAALLRNGYSEQVCAQTVEYAKRLHYIDDARYARIYVENQAKKKSRLELRLELLKKGLPKEIIEQSLEGADTEEEKTVILRLLEKRGFDAETAGEKEIQKQYRYLMNKGFHYGDIVDVIKQYTVLDCE